MDDIKSRLQELGLTLPPVPAQFGNYVPAALANGFCFTNQIAMRDGRVMHPGTVPLEVNTIEAGESARQCALNVLAVLNKALGGNLRRLLGCVQVTGYVACAPDFADHPKIINVASDLFVTVLGDRGRHARASVGASSLPMLSPVQLSVVFAVEE